MPGQQSYKGPLDYIDVATRIVEFREKYPNGRLRQKSVEFIEFANKAWVVYTAEAWRDETDPAPAHGTAWEPVPGPTQFTRDSELQNAETAAWGRAMVAALAVDTRKGIASSEEVRNRQAPTPAEKRAEQKDNAAIALDGIAKATDPKVLDQIQDWANSNGLHGHKPVQDALDAKRAELGHSGSDAWAVAEVKP